MELFPEYNKGKNRRNRIINKIRSYSGMSLLEMLCAILILLLATGGMTTAVSLAAKQFQMSMRNSESQVLCSTIKTVLGNELAYTTEIQVDALNDEKGNVLKFQSQNYTIEESLSAIRTDNSGTDGYGQILLGNSEDTSESLNILGKGAYPHGLGAKVTSFTYDNKTYCFTVQLSIGYNGTECYSEEFQVMNVNKTEATTTS